MSEAEANVAHLSGKRPLCGHELGHQRALDRRARVERGDSPLRRFDRSNAVAVGWPAQRAADVVAMCNCAYAQSHRCGRAARRSAAGNATVPGIFSQPVQRIVSVNPRIENSGVLVRPMMIAPACFRLAATGELPGAMLFLKATTPFELAWPSRSHTARKCFAADLRSSNCTR